MARTIEKIDSESNFITKIFAAHMKYTLMFGGVDTPWSEKNRKEMAASAAFEVGLQYADGRVDAKIVIAIRAIANSKKNSNQRVWAILDAWGAYSRGWK